MSKSPMIYGTPPCRAEVPIPPCADRGTSLVKEETELRPAQSNCQRSSLLLKKHPPRTSSSVVEGVAWSHLVCLPPSREAGAMPCLYTTARTVQAASHQ